MQYNAMHRNAMVCMYVCMYVCISTYIYTQNCRWICRNLVGYITTPCELARPLYLGSKNELCGFVSAVTACDALQRWVRSPGWLFGLHFKHGSVSSRIWDVTWPSLNVVVHVEDDENSKSVYQN